MRRPNSAIQVGDIPIRWNSCSQWRTTWPDWRNGQQWPWLALICTAEALARQGELVRPAAVCAFLLDWLRAPCGVKAAAGRLFDELRLRLPPEALAAALDQGRQSQLEDLVAQVGLE